VSRASSQPGSPGSPVHIQFSICLSITRRIGFVYRLRKSELAGMTIHIKLRWSDFTTLTRQITLAAPTNLDHDIYQIAVRLFEKHWPKGKAVRLIGVGVSGFETPARQLGLWETSENHSRQQLQETLDNLREKFGEQAVRRGRD